jgi:glutaredoxin
VKRNNIILIALLASLLVPPTSNVHAQTGLPVVHAVLFYSPTCGHCQYVITNTLLPMIDQYGDQLQIIGIDVTQEQGQALFMYAMQKFKLESAGVPFLVIDNLYLVGSVDIPEKFPGLVENYLAQGGVDWPDLPGVSDTPSTAGTPEPAPTSIPVARAVLFYRSACSHCQKTYRGGDPAAL